MFGKKQNTHIGFNPFSKEKKQKPGVTTKIIEKISQWFRGKLNPSSCIQREIVQQATILVPINYEIVGAQTIEQDSVQICKSFSSQQLKRNKFTSFNEYLQEEEHQVQVPLKQQLKESKFQRKEKEHAYDNMLPDDLHLLKGLKNNDRRDRLKARRVSQQLFKKRKLNGIQVCLQLEKQMQIAIKFQEKLNVIEQMQDSINESRILVVQESDDSLKNNSLLVDIKESKKEKEQIILTHQKEEKEQENQPPILQIDQIIESHQKGMKKSQSMINIMNEDAKSLACSPKKIEPSRKQSFKNEEKPEEKKPQQYEQQESKQEEQKQIEQPKSLIEFIVTGAEKDKKDILINKIGEIPERTNVSDTPLFGFGKNLDSQFPRVLSVGASLFPSVDKKEQSQQQSSDSGQNLQANLFTFCQSKPKVDNSESLNQPLTSDTSSSAPANQQSQKPEGQPLFSLFNQNDSLQIKKGTQSLFANLLDSKKEQQQGEQGISQNQQKQPSTNIEAKPTEVKSVEVKTQSLFGDLLKKDSLFAPFKQEKKEDSPKLIQKQIKEQESQISKPQEQSQKNNKTSEEIKNDNSKPENIQLFSSVPQNPQPGNPFKTDKPSLFSGMTQQNQQKPEENKPLGLFENLLKPTQAQPTTNDNQRPEQPKLFANILNNTEQKDQPQEVQTKESNQKQVSTPLFNLNPGLFAQSNTKQTQDTPKIENQKESESKQELKTPAPNAIGLNCQWKSSDDQKQNSSQQIVKGEDKKAQQASQKEESKQSPFGFLANKQPNESSDLSQKKQIQTPQKPIDNPFLQQSPKIDQEQIKSYFSQQSSSSQAIMPKSFTQTSNFENAILFQPQQNVPSMFNLPPQQATSVQAQLFQTNPNSSLFFSQQQPQNQLNQTQKPQQQNSFQQFGGVLQAQNGAMSNEMEIIESTQTQQNFQSTSIFNSVFQPSQQQMTVYNQQAPTFQMQPQQTTQQIFGSSSQPFSFAPQNSNNEVMIQQQQSQSKYMSMLGLFSLDASKPGFQSGSLNSSFTSKNGNKKKQRITEN